MSPPFHLFDMVAVRAQSDITGVAPADHDAIGGVIELRHLLVGKEAACDELETLAALGKLKNLVEHSGVVEGFALSADGDALDVGGVDQRRQVLPGEAR